MHRNRMFPGHYIGILFTLILFMFSSCGSGGGGGGDSTDNNVSCKSECTVGDSNSEDEGNDDSSDSDVDRDGDNDNSTAASADGTYDYTAQTGTLIINITSTTFNTCGPDETGSESFTVQSLSETSMTWLENSGDESDQLIWTRTEGSGTDIFGTWTLPVNGDTMTIAFDDTGTLTVTGPADCDENDSYENLEYVTSFGDPSVINPGYYDAIDVASDGKVYVHTGLIHEFSSSHNYSGVFINAETSLSGTKYNFVIDSLDRMHIYTPGWGIMHHNTYELDGTLFSQSSGSGNNHIMTDIDRDMSGNHYMIPVSGSGSEAEGRSFFVWKVNHDFSSRLDTVEKNDFLQMLPGAPNEFDVTLSGIKVLNNGYVLICVDFDGESNSDMDGILVLDQNLDKLAYIGGEWLFNAPRAADVDENDNVYVSSIYGNHISVFNSNAEKIAYIEGSDIPGIDDNEDFKPVDIRVKNNRLYVLNMEDGKIYVFKTVTQQG